MVEIHVGPAAGEPGRGGPGEAAADRRKRRWLLWGNGWWPIERPPCREEPRRWIARVASPHGSRATLNGNHRGNWRQFKSFAEQDRRTTQWYTGLRPRRVSDLRGESGSRSEL